MSHLVSRVFQDDLSFFVDFQAYRVELAFKVCLYLNIGCFSPLSEIAKSKVKVTFSISPTCGFAFGGTCFNAKYTPHPELKGLIEPCWSPLAAFSRWGKVSIYLSQRIQFIKTRTKCEMETLQYLELNEQGHHKKMATLFFLQCSLYASFCRLCILHFRRLSILLIMACVFFSFSSFVYSPFLSFVCTSLLYIVCVFFIFVICLYFFTVHSLCIFHFRRLSILLFRRLCILLFTVCLYFISLFVYFSFSSFVYTLHLYRFCVWCRWYRRDNAFATVSEFKAA